MAALPEPDRQPQFYRDVPTKRLIAWVVDTVLILALSVIAVIMTAFVGLLIWPLLYLGIGFLYRVATLAGGSATLGMRLAGIELRRHDGGPFDGTHALLHTGLYTACLMLPVFQIVSIVLMLTTARGQGLPDLALGTVALNRRAR
ncbi:RDD family protein [Seohaeicola nanhaiensis]|uniref:RDD family protein n=1 Tax=Seohaeicola nanhaiensis TaxID=1387282 RepID=A0ABV9KEN1_9RHOB